MRQASPKVLVAGTKFGQVYLQAFGRPGFPFTLAGILAQGSPRSRACAEHYGVPLYTDVDDVPGDVRLACVVIRSGLLGGAGAEVARALMERGIHVLQEHPLHHDELAACLRTAAREGVVYHLNSFYVHTPPVRRFVAAATALLARQQARYVDAACGFQVAYAMLDMIGETLGAIRPWGLAPPAPPSPELAGLARTRPPFRSLDGVIGGVPVTFRVQNQLDPADPDNHAHLLHRITLGTEGGHLTLVGTHGPITWSPRPDFPQEVQDARSATVHYAAKSGDGSGWADHLDVPSVLPLGEPGAPSYRQIFDALWPRGVERALTELRDAARQGEPPARRGQYHLTLCRIWQDMTAKLGPPELLYGERADPLPPADVEALAKAAE